MDWSPGSVQTMFDVVAPDYDKLNTLLSGDRDRAWRKAAAAQVQPGSRVLDLCAGTGPLARTILARDPTCLVSALDFSAAMISIGLSKNSPVGLQWLRGDGLHLPFRNGSFAAITCGFGFRNFNPQGTPAGLAECFRVLKPGGKLIVLEFFPRPGLVRNFLQRTYLRLVLPFIGDVIWGKKGAYRYLSRTMQEYLTKEQFEEAVKDSGLRLHFWKDLTFGVCSLVVAEKAG